MLTLARPRTLETKPSRGWSAERLRNGERHSELGATMLEFALVVGIVFGLISGLFDLGLGLYRYSLLTHATSNVNRQMAVELNRQPITTPAPCRCSNGMNDCSAAANQRIQQYANTELSLNLNGLTATAQILTVSGAAPITPAVVTPGFCTDRGNQLVLRIISTYEYRCILCIMMQRSIPLTTSSQATIENRCNCL